MKNIAYSDIDFSKLEVLDESENSILYTEKVKKQNVYKIYKQKKKEILLRKMKVLKLYSKINTSDKLVKASAIIMGDKFPKGQKEKYIETMKFSTFFDNKDPNCLYVALNCSNSLQEIHNSEGRPVIGDVQFDNIGVDRAYNHYCFDCDSYGIFNIKPSNISKVLGSYCSYMNYSLTPTQNTDRLSFMLSFFSSIFKKHIYAVSEKEYDEYAEKYPRLKELKDIFIDLKMSYGSIPDVPYLHELIKE